MYIFNSVDKRGFRNFFTNVIFCPIILLIILFFVSSAIAGVPVGEVYVYNVGVGEFSVVWQVDVPSTCTVKVFYDINAANEVTTNVVPTFNVTSNTDASALAQARGVMQVDVKGLPSEPDTYYIQTSSTETATSTPYVWPAAGNLIPVTTEKFFLADPYLNGLLELMPYDSNGINAGDPLVNLLTDGVVAIVDAGGNYPVSSDISGWPQDQYGVYFAVVVDFSKLRLGYGEPNYLDWLTAPADHNIKIMCFGGLVPNVGIGQRIIETTYPQGLLGSSYGCLSDHGITDMDGCAYTTSNQLILYTNRPPEIVITPAEPYTVNPGGLFTIQVCAYDPDEGDTITDIYLGGDVPSGMDRTFPLPADANCASIEWTAPSPTGGFYRNIQVFATDGVTPNSETFMVTVFNGPPTEPDVSISATTTPITTDADLICSVDASSIENPDPADQGNELIDYEWYENGVLIPGAGGTNTNVYTNTLSNAETERDKQYFCRVKVHDNDGFAPSVDTSTVDVINSSPGAPGNVEVTPVQPTADDDLICEIKTPSTDPDNDPVTYKYRWTCTNCGNKSAEESGPKPDLTDTLDKEKTAKGEVWTCEVYATDGVAQSSTAQSNSVTIQNKPPTVPGNVRITNSTPVYTNHPLTCEIGIESTDPDNDPVEYKYRWTCTDCGGKPAEESELKTELTDTLPSNKTAKGEQWTCEVWANDGFTDSSSVTTSAVTIENSSPEGLSAQVTPDPNASVSDDLLCTATGVTDEDGDDISYRYEWKKGDVTEVTRPFTVEKTSDTLEAINTGQGETWSCVVTAKDTSDEEISDTSNQVLIYNRFPIITTDPPEPIEWDEGGHHEMRIIVNDPDGNNFTLQIGTGYVDPTALDWIEYDDTNAIITADPPVDSSSLDVGYGPGVFTFNFIVDETDGTPNRHVEKLISATVRIPAAIVDDFEYDANAPTLAENGWYRLQGSGQMQLKQEDTADPNSNHYLKTTVTTTPKNNSQLGFIIYKTIEDGKFDNLYPKIHFSVSDKNLFYLDARVRGVKAGNEDTFFLRYINQDPNTAGWETKVSGKYVSRNVGTESIDPNGREVTEIIRDMDADLFNATGFHYVYLRGIVLRGDVNHLDNIKVSSVARPPLKEVENLTAAGNENQVTLQWTLPPGQADTIAGYNIYMKKNSPPTKDEQYKIVTVGPNKTSHTEKGLDNNETYYFIVTAIDWVQKETNGKSASATPVVTIPLAPIGLKASSVDSVIELSWENPPNQHPDLYGYTVYYCDCVSGGCPGCFAELVEASKADATGLFKHYITRDANQDPLQFDNRYDFTVKAKDTAQPANFSDGVHVSILLVPPSAKVVDNFDLNYAPGDTLMRQGWYRLQGKGKMTLKLDTDGVNHYLEKQGSLDHIIVKWLKDPADYINPNLKMDVRSPGDFRVDVYLKGKDGKNYFLSYKGNKNTDDDSTGATVEERKWFVFTIGWKSKGSTPLEWYPIERNLDDDLMTAKGVGFDMVLGILLRGTLDIDNIVLGEGILDVENLTARAGDSEVLLSWSVTDPNKIDDTRIYVDGSMDANSNDIDRIAPDKNDYRYLVTGLTNNTEYEFRVVQVVEGEESKGVSVNATPMVYKTDVFTFDDQSDLNEWSLSTTTGVSFDVVYDSGVQSNGMYLNPPGDYPDRYYAAKENMNVSDVTGMTCKIKTSFNFVIWVDIVDTSGLQFMLGFVPGGTKGDSLRFGSFAYYYLGPGYMDGSWHHLDLNLDAVMGNILPDNTTADMVKGIYFGGRIYVDDVSLY